MITQLGIAQEKISGFCSRNGIKRLALFGSALTQRFGPESDVDLLVEFQKGKEPGFLGLARMERELSEMTGRRIDLRTPAELSRHFREEVEQSAEVQYAAG